MPSLDCRWIFTLDVAAETIADTYDEVRDVCQEIWTAGEGFWTPTDVSFVPGNPVHKVVVDTHTDIGFEKTKIGERNLRRLVEFLTELDTRLDPHEVDFYSERYLAFQSDVVPDKFLADEHLDS